LQKGREHSFPAKEDRMKRRTFVKTASQGLAAWFHNCDKENTAKEFKLRPEQRVLFAQTVGYPRKT